MTVTDTAAESARCLRCGRTLKNGGTYGPKCAAKVRAAANNADLSEWTPRQLDDARELIEDGGVVPTTRARVFRTVSSDGTAVYLTTAHWCGCPAGLKAKHCYHRAAVVIVLATSAVAPAAAPVAVPVPAPAPAGDIWAELDRLTDAFMAVA